MELEVVERAAVGPTERVLLLLPGYGDDATWFLPHLESLDPDRRWHAAVATPPRAVEAGPTWFPPDGGATGDDVRAATAAVDRAGARLLDAHDLGPEALVVIGFSQGGAVALATVIDPVVAVPPAAVGALAAFLPPLADDVEPTRAAGRPVLVAHGTDDEHVDLLLGRSAASLLTRAGAAVTWTEVAGGHEISPAMAAATRRWLDERRSGATPPAA